MLYLGIQSYIANRHGRQDRKGNMLGTFLKLSNSGSDLKVKAKIRISAHRGGQVVQANSRTPPSLDGTDRESCIPCCMSTHDTKPEADFPQRRGG